MTVSLEFSISIKSICDVLLNTTLIMVLHKQELDTWRQVMQNIDMTLFSFRRAFGHISSPRPNRLNTSKPFVKRLTAHLMN